MEIKNITDTWNKYFVIKSDGKPSKKIDLRPDLAGGDLATGLLAKLDAIIETSRATLDGMDAALQTAQTPELPYEWDVADVSEYLTWRRYFDAANLPNKVAVIGQLADATLHQRMAFADAFIEDEDKAARKFSETVRLENMATVDEDALAAATDNWRTASLQHQAFVERGESVRNAIEAARRIEPISHSGAMFDGKANEHDGGW